jgi:hypothetical protein
MYVHCQKQKMSVVRRLKTNHKRDVHCTFILGLLAEMQTIPSMLETLLGKKKFSSPCYQKTLIVKYIGKYEDKFDTFLRAVNRALDGVFRRQKNRGGKSHDRVPLNYLLSVLKGGRINTDDCIGASESGSPFLFQPAPSCIIDDISLNG